MKSIVDTIPSLSQQHRGEPQSIQHTVQNLKLYTVIHMCITCVEVPFYLCYTWVILSLGYKMCHVYNGTDMLYTSVYIMYTLVYTVLQAV